jgi:predicted nucleotidyltransferase
VKRRGSGAKPSRTSERVLVSYPSSRWARLESLRNRAIKVINALATWSQTALTHGSVARGDVDDKSDVDVLIPSNVNTQLVEATLENAGFTIFSREIAQATPSHSPKAHIQLDVEQTTSVTVPLTPFRSMELEFYAFGGKAALPELKAKIRSAGCTKKLTLIEPTTEGHFESPVVGRESEVARLLGVSVAIVTLSVEPVCISGFQLEMENRSKKSSKRVLTRIRL